MLGAVYRRDEPLYAGDGALIKALALGSTLDIGEQLTIRPVLYRSWVSDDKVTPRIVPRAGVLPPSPPPDYVGLDWTANAGKGAFERLLAHMRPSAATWTSTWAPSTAA